MPTGKTITRKEAGVFLPGDPVESEIGWGFVVWPSEQMQTWPHGDDDVAIKWMDGSYSWKPASKLKWRTVR